MSHFCIDSNFDLFIYLIEEIRELAEYLRFLAGNDTAYEEYFCWKTQYQRIRTRRACELCKQLHNQSLYTPSRVYANMTKFWNRKQCKNRMH
ncbi:unnamed protein product [Porites evermanni]|uniref:Fucosyltransferase n=1 Tax=Porites evermanni TaxID=104178 RepID=A0ABN8PLR2_9CNID|nr:unnamed protein product [Porites evermanni]